MMPSARIALVAGILACALSISCSDDPVAPGGSYVAPSYQGTIQSLDARFWDVSGAGPDHVYAGGDVLLHYDGAHWNALPTPSGYEGFQFRSVLGFADGSAALAVDDRVWVYRDGGWVTLPRAPDWTRDLVGTAPDNLYTLGGDGVLHFDGESWTSIPVEKRWEINAMTTGVAGELWLCGYEGRLDHFDGEEWATVYLDSLFLFRTVATTPSGRTFIGSNQNVLEVTGFTMNNILREQMFQPVVRTDGEVLYAVGSDYNQPRSLIAQYQSNSWRIVASSTGAFREFWVGDGDIIAVGNGNTIWQGNETGGRVVEPFPARGAILDAVAVDDAIYTIGESSHRYQAGVWTDLEKDYVTNIPGRAIDGRRYDDIYAVGDAMILHFDGKKWEWVNGALGTWLSAVWVETNGDVIAVGEGTVLVEFDGFDWTKRTVNISSGGFTDVLGIEDVVFVVGYNGLLGMRREDREWYFMRPTSSDLRALWGSDKEHVYAVTSTPNELLFFDGDRWSTMTIPGPELDNMVRIWGTSPSNIFVLDFEQGLMRFDGRDWSPAGNLLPQMRSLTGVGQNVLTVGHLGSVLYRR